MESRSCHPLFKKDKADYTDNYRPISILPAVSKVLERAVYHQLYAYLQWHKVLSPYECGFRKCHSMEWATTVCASRIQSEGTLTKAGLLVLIWSTCGKCLIPSTIKCCWTNCGDLEWWMVNMRGLQTIYRTAPKLLNFRVYPVLLNLCVLVYHGGQF